MPPKPVVYLAASVLKALCFPSHHRFMNSLKNPELAQKLFLRQLLGDLSRTAYGKEFGIAGNEDYAAFAMKIPVANYETLEPWIERQLATKGNIITPHRIKHVEPTSGSSGAEKKIPYTSPLLRQFAEMFRIWAYDLLKYGIAPETGRIFMSVSAPKAGEFPDDRAYLPASLRWLLSPFLLLPQRNMHSIAMSMAAAKDLEVVSVWSPSYLLAVIEYLAERGVTLHWSKLKLISCWDGAFAAPLAEKLRAMFPGVLVQGKGLLATEAPLTVPLAGGYAPLVNSVYFEFELPDGRIKRLHELQFGERAEVIISQRAGLARYRLGDMVEVGTTIRGTPSLRFIGRSKVCDLVGEKLNEVFVREALTPLLLDQAFMLIPSGRGYILLAETITADTAVQADAALSAAHHYAFARQMGQLQPLRVIKVEGLAMRIRAFQIDRGMKAGNIKDTPLIVDPQLARALIDCLAAAPSENLRPAPLTAA